jgi:hypothetical protein
MQHVEAARLAALEVDLLIMSVLIASRLRIPG